MKHHFKVQLEFEVHDSHKREVVVRNVFRFLKKCLAPFLTNLTMTEIE